jgi:hypothetical protein
MKDVFVLSETLRESERLYQLTIDTLGDQILKCTRTPKRTIKIERMRFYFTNTNTWYANYRYSNLGADLIRGWRFEKMLDAYKAKRRKRYGI